MVAANASSPALRVHAEVEVRAQPGGPQAPCRHVGGEYERRVLHPRAGGVEVTPVGCAAGHGVAGRAVEPTAVAHDHLRPRNAVEQPAASRDALAAQVERPAKALRRCRRRAQGDAQCHQRRSAPRALHRPPMSCGRNSDGVASRWHTVHSRARLVIHLGIVAGETEGAIRREAGHGRCLVAGDAVHMRLARVRLPACRVAVAGGAVAAGVMMLVMASLAACCLRGGGQGHRCGVAGDAGDGGMTLMAERHLAGTIGCLRGARLHVNGFADLQLLHARRVVAGRAIGLRRRLVMADEASARGLERDGACLRLHVVAGDAVEFLVVAVREGPGRCSWWDRVPRRRIVDWRVTLAVRRRGHDVERAGRALQGLQRVEGQGRLAALGRACLRALVAADTVGGIHPRRVRRVTGLAPGRDLPVRGALMEVDLLDVRVAARVRAALECVLRLHVLVRVVAHAAGATMRVALGIEVREPLPHRMAGEALLRPRSQGALGGVEGRELRYDAREPVADHAMQPRLSRHLAQPDVHVLGQVTALLGAGAVHRRKAVGRARMTGEALHLAAERRAVRLEVSAMAGGLRNGLPRFLRCALFMALFADIARDLAVLGNWSSRGHPTSTASSSPLPCGS